MAKTQHGRELTGEEMAQMLDEFVNGGGERETRAFVEQVTKRTHRTLQQRIAALFMRTIEGWAALPEYSIDPRNEAAVKLSKRIVEVTDKCERSLPLI